MATPVEKFQLKCPVCGGSYQNTELFVHYLTHSEEAKLTAFRADPDAFFTIVMAGASLVYAELDDAGRNALYFSLIVFQIDAYKAGEAVFRQHKVEFSAFLKEMGKKAMVLKSRAEMAQRRYH